MYNGYTFDNWPPTEHIEKRFDAAVDVLKRNHGHHFYQRDMLRSYAELERRGVIDKYTDALQALEDCDCKPSDGGIGTNTCEHCRNQKQDQEIPY